MSEMYLRQPQFTYSACGPFTKHKQRIQKFKKPEDTNFIYKIELEKACFAHDGYQRGLASMVYKFFDKNSASLADKSTKESVVNTKLTPQNQQLAKELHKPIIKKFEKRKGTRSI